MATHPTASPRRRRRSRAPDRAGYTLVELLTALTVGGIVTAVVLQLVLAQGRVARLQTARTEVQQNSRAAVELLVSELRGVDPAAVGQAAAASLAFRSARAWGSVCLHTPERLAVAFPTAAVPALHTGDELLAIPPVGAAAEWRFLEVDDRTGNGVERAQAQAACASAGADLPAVGGTASPVRMYAPRAEDPDPTPLGIAAGEAGLPPGTPVYAFQPVRYELAASPSPPGWWLRRNTGPAMQMQPLAGPVAEHGLRFEYLDAGGVSLPTPLGAAERRRIRRVRVDLVVLSRERFDGEPLRDSAVAAAHLRNPF